MTGPHRLAMPVFILAAFCAVLTAHAQFVDWPPTPQAFGVFRFDSTFLIGAHTIKDPELARYTLHMNFSQEYRQTVDGVYNAVENPVNADDRADSARFVRSDQIGFKYIWLINDLPWFVYDAKSRENWFGLAAPGVLNIDFKTPFRQSWYPSSIWSIGTYKNGDAYNNQQFFNYLTITARDTANPTDTTGRVLMAGDARNMYDVLSQSNPERYDTLFHIWHDENRNARPSHIADSLAALYDKSKTFDVSVAIRDDSNALSDLTLNIPDTAAIGYLDVYIRDTAMQGRPAVPRYHDSVWVWTGFDTVWVNQARGEFRYRHLGEWQPASVTRVPVDICRCAIYRPLKQDTITKRDYLDAAAIKRNEVGDDFIEVSTEVEPEPFFRIDPDSFWDGSDNPHPFGWSNRDSLALSYCEWMFNYRRALPDTSPLHLPDGSFLRYQRDDENSPLFFLSNAEDADLIYRFSTTRRVTLSFVRGRVSQRLMRLVERGAADSILLHDARDIYRYPLFKRLLMRLGIADEVGHSRVRAQNYITGLVQSVLTDSSDARGLWLNPPENPDGIRVGMGDFDSLRLSRGGPLHRKMVHMAARQAYKLHIGIPTPITYLNPELISSFVRDTLYRAQKRDTLINNDTILSRAIARNSLWDYRYYNRRIQTDVFGSFYDRNEIVAASHDGGMIPSVARAVDAYRFRYRNLNEYSSPVINVVQTHGFYHFPPNNYQYRLGGFGLRIPTAEEVIGQSWASVACNVNGLIYGDIQDDGYTFGVLHYKTNSYADEYGTQRFGLEGDSIPRMWLARKSRLEAMREVTTAIHHIDSVVGWRKLLYEQDQMSLHDPRADFATMPMLSAVRAERPHRYGYTFDTTAQGFRTYAFTPSDTFDTPEETFMEVTQFYPSTADLPGSATNSRYLLFFNRRLWPVDDRTYSSGSVDTLDMAALYTGPSSDTGLGAIDVRRPVVTLKNSTSTMADSFIVEKIGPFGAWKDTLACGVETPLDWITPGRADFYRITPIPRGVSAYGTPFNNSTHAENLSTDTAEDLRVVVVERDSAIYLRRFRSATGWEPDLLLSPAIDSARLPGGTTRRAHCLYPAIASARDDSALLVVWQRVESGTLKKGTVEALYIPGRPTSAAVAAGTRLRLSLPRLIDQPWKKMVPAVTGTDGGWIVAWGSPLDGIELVGVRNRANPTVGQDVSLVGKVRAVAVADNAKTIYLDTICSYPTLAYVSNATFPGTDTTAAKTLHWAHLAWQQGNDSSQTVVAGKGPYIMYKRVGVDIPDSGRPMLNLTTLEEHVSQGLPGCRFLHPSIAADSVRVGVAFESHMLIAPMSLPSSKPVGPIQAVTLRFRDTVVPGGLAGAAGGWRTQVYLWGDSINRYEYPSFTQFPKRSRTAALFAPVGALAWHGLPTFGTTRTRQYFYRTGDRMNVELPFGQYPTMMNAPYVAASPLSHTGVLYRGDATTGFSAVRGWGETATYYPGSTLMEPTGSAFTGLFAAAPKAHGIYGGFTLGNWSAVDSGASCDFKVISGGLRFSWPKLEYPPDHEDGGPGLPPVFGGVPEQGKTWVTSIEEAGEISRTNVFPAGTVAVPVKRYISKSPGLESWLSLYPYDSAMGSAADVKLLLELVRSSDERVLWEDDTVSARYLSGLVSNEEVAVPVHLYATEGEGVYIRLRAVATAGLEYDVSGGFHFYEDLPGIWLTKRSTGEGEGQKGSGGEVESALRVEVIPNPTRGEVRIVWAGESGGEAEIVISDITGRRLHRAQQEAGAREFVWSAGHLPPGTYYVTLRTGNKQATRQFSVVR